MVQDKPAPKHGRRMQWSVAYICARGHASVLARQIHIRNDALLYTMTTIRLTEAQKDLLNRATGILEGVLGRSLSQGEAVEALATFALRNRALLAKSSRESARSLENDPFYDMSIIFDMGKTDERTVDKVLYGK